MDYKEPTTLVLIDSFGEIPGGTVFKDFNYCLCNDVYEVEYLGEYINIPSEFLEAR